MRWIAFGLMASVLGLVATPALASLGVSVTLAPSAPGTIYPGQTTTLRVTLSNSNAASDITQVAFSNFLANVASPNGLRFVNGGTIGYSCTAGGVSTSTSGAVTVSNATQNVQLTGGVIPAASNGVDGSCVIDLPVTAVTNTGNVATYTYQIADQSVTGNDGAAQSNIGTVQQSVNVNALSKPTISKSFSGAGQLVLGGGPVNLQITLSNPNPVALSGMGFTDNFPTLANPAAGNAVQSVIQVANSNQSTILCTGGSTAPTFSAGNTAGDTSVVVSGGTLAAGSSCTVTVPVVAAHTGGNYSTQQTNLISAGSVTSDVGLAASGNASAQVTVTSPLQVSKTGPLSLAAGQTGTFVITLTNNGSASLTANFNDSPIDGVGANSTGLKISSVTDVNGQNANLCGATVTVANPAIGFQVSGAVILPAGSCAFYVHFTGTLPTANTPQAYTNTLAQGAVNVGNPAIVSQPASATVTIYDTLHVLKAQPSPTDAAAASPVKYQVTVENWSASAMSNVVVTDTLTESQSYLTGTINGVNYSPSVSGAGCGSLSTSTGLGQSNVVLNVSSIPARTNSTTPGSCTVTFWGMTNVSGTVTSAYNNQILANGVCYTNGANTVCNGAGSGNVSGTVSPVLQVTKAFSPAGPLNEGAVTRMTITLSNNSVNPLSSIAISDNLPLLGTGAQMRVATPANAATTCGGSPVITALAASTSVQMNGATVPARANSATGAAGTCILQVDIVAAAGAYTNQVSVTGTQTYANGTSANNVGPVTASAAITFNSSLCSSSAPCSKTFSPASISSGGHSTVTVHLVNSGALPLTNVGFTDSFPFGMLLASPTNAHTTCSGSTSVSAVAGAQSIGLAGATIAGNGTCDLVFDVTATGSASWVNTLGARSITADGGVTNQTAVVGTLNYLASTAMTLAKSTSPSSLTFPGQSSVLMITIGSGTAAVTNLHLTDYFTSDGTVSGSPNGMVIAAVPAAATTCAGGQVVATTGAASVTLSGASLTASNSCTVTVNVTSTAVGGIINYLPAGSIQDDQGLTNPAQVSTSLTTQSNIGVVKKFTPSVVQPGVRSRLRITFYNPTALPVTNLHMVDPLLNNLLVPVGPNVVSTCSGASVSTPSNNSVHIDNGSIAAANGGIAASCYVELDVTAASVGDYPNTIAASAVTAVVGGIAVTNSQPTTDTLLVRQPLVLHKAFSSLTQDSGNPSPFTTGTDTKAPGVPAVFTFNFTNPNSAALTNTSLLDTLPSNLVVSQNPVIGGTCANGSVTAPADATSIGLTGFTIPGTSSGTNSCTVTVTVVSNISGTYTDASAAGAVTTAEGVTNQNTTSAQLVVSTPPSVAKQFSPSVIAPNASSTLTLVLGNSNSSDAILSSALTDTFPTAPGNLQVAASPNMVSTCTNATVTANAGDLSLVVPSGTHIPPGGCTISVAITGSTGGAYTNNIPAGALVTNFGSNPQPANAPLVISTQGFVSGKVFLDNNVTPNGTFEQGTDTPLSGVGVSLHSSADCSNSSLVAQSGVTNPVTTDALGNYLFSGLAAGTYTVCEVALAGSSAGIATAGPITAAPGSSGGGTSGTATAAGVSPSLIASITLGAGSNSSVSGSGGNNFARVAPSSVSGTVYLDQNNNGLIDGTDSGISGVTVELHKGDGSVVTTQTDSAGNYSFSNLAPGTYTLAEPGQPVNTVRGITSAGSVPHGGTAGTATSPTTTPSQIAGIVLPPNTASVANNFGVIPSSRVLSGQVYLDHNGNGALDGSDYGLVGLTVTVTGTDVNGHAVQQTAQTDTSGNYRFTTLPESNGSGYTITGPLAPTGTSSGSVTVGSTGTTASNANRTITGASLAGSNTVSAGNNFAVVPGNVPDLTLSKTHSPSSFAAGSATGYYTITPSNVGSLATTGVITVTDTLPVGMTLAQAPSGSGWSCSGAVGDNQFSCTSSAVIAANGTGPVIVARVAVAANTSGQILTNTAVISGGGEPVALNGNNTATDPTAIANPAGVSGHVWLDSAHNATFNNSGGLSAWTVQLLLNGNVVGSTTTASDGSYSFSSVAPGSGYQIRFLHGASSALWGTAVPNEGGLTYSSGVTAGTTDGSGNRSGANPAGATVSGGTLSNLTLTSGVTTLGQSLPVDPSGVVYDAITRQPVAGAVVTISGPGSFNPSADLVGGQATQTTGSDGLYQFLLAPTAPSGTYTVSVTTYPSGYANQPSTLIPRCTTALTVSAAPSPAMVQANVSPPPISATVQPAASCPSTSGGLNATNQATTQYYQQFVLNNASANVLNNNIPLDPVSGSGFLLTKTGDRAQAQIGDSVRYTIDVRLNSNSVLQGVSIVDRLPPGFTFIPGTVQLNGVAAPNPQGGVGPVLAFSLGSLRGSTNVGSTAVQDLKLQYRVRIGVGAQQGNGINTALAFGCNTTSGCLQGSNFQAVANSVQSNRGQFKVTVSGGAFSDEACVLGKIFVDCNNNHIQDEEELGIPGVRLYFEDGGFVVSDSEGKYSRCGMPPRSHVLVVDRTTLPVGARLTTSSNRNLGDANSLFIDLKNGELHRADFIEGSCSNRVLEQVKARRTQGEIRAVETERNNGPGLRFYSKPPAYPREGTDSANQPLVQPRQGGDHAQ